MLVWRVGSCGGRKEGGQRVAGTTGSNRDSGGREPGRWKDEEQVAFFAVTLGGLFGGILRERWSWSLWGVGRKKKESGDFLTRPSMLGRSKVGSNSVSQTSWYYKNLKNKLPSTSRSKKKKSLDRGGPLPRNVRPDARSRYSDLSSVRNRKACTVRSKFPLLSSPLLVQQLHALPKPTSHSHPSHFPPNPSPNPPSLPSI